MIFGHIDHLDTAFAWLPGPLKTVLAHLKATDFEGQPAGYYELQGKDIHVMICDLRTEEPASLRPEVHRDYVDVQFLWRGRERIGVAIDTGQNVVAQDLLAESDLLLYRDVEDEFHLEMRPGNFAIFYPSDVHRRALSDRPPGDHPQSGGQSRGGAVALVQ